ncbi:MAG: replication initiator protein A [Acidobacteria bacterium]|nr:replication initiator protein A [Acidobacteriota bacterium]
MGRVCSENPGLARAGDVLRETHAEFVVSKQKLRKAEGICLVREKRETAAQTLGFTARPFVLCGLPIRRPPEGQLLFERRNGHFTLQITGHPQFGLPFGQDRLVPIFLATMAVRQQSRIVRFESAAELLDTFGLSKGGKEYRRLVAAFERIFGATIFFGTESNRSAAKVIHRSRFNFLSEAQIWYSRDSEQAPLSEEFANVVVLSDEFYQEISEHPIPADLEAVKVLACAPAALDLFVWLTYRCFSAKGPERIPLFGSFGLVNQLGCVEYSRPRRFRAMLDQWLASIRRLWPDCPAVISSDGRALLVNYSKSVLPQQESRAWLG